MVILRQDQIARGGILGEIALPRRCAAVIGFGLGEYGCYSNHAGNRSGDQQANTHAFFSTTLSDIRPSLPSALLDEICGSGTQLSHRGRSEEHTSELQSLMRISYAVFCLKTKKETKRTKQTTKH